LIITPFKKDNTKQAAACGFKGPVSPEKHSLRLLNMKIKDGNGYISYVLRSACLTLMEIVYHKKTNLYTKIFRQAFMSRFLDAEFFEKWLHLFLTFAIIRRIIYYYGISIVSGEDTL